MANEYLAIGVLLSTAALSFGAMGGKKKEAPPPASGGKSIIERAKEAVPFNAGSRCVWLYVRWVSGGLMWGLGSEEEQL